MANYCNFNMCIVGRRSDIEAFYNAMILKGEIRMGRGAEAEIEFDDENHAAINGCCKWSVVSAMVEDAETMRTNPEHWAWDEDINPCDFEFITLFEACLKWNLVVEFYSEESGCTFQEHCVCNKGVVICNERAEWHEYCIDNYETKNDAESDLGIEITDEEWNGGDSFVGRGGFGSWDFKIIEGLDVGSPK